MTLRVVIADDSEIAAGVLESLLEEDAEILVVGRARTGAELLSMPTAAIADVVLVDLLMPELDGLSVIRSLSAHAAVIVVSSLPRDSAVVREALAQGACCAFAKRDLADTGGRERLRGAVHAARRSSAPSAARLLLVAGSTGAIPALASLARGLGHLRLPILVVQHLPDQREWELARALLGLGAQARPARSGDPLTPGFLVAPSGVHLTIDERERVRLTRDAPIHGHRPSADALFRSAVPLARRTMAIVLSGLGDDGAEALAALSDNGGLCFAQAPAECSAPGMPRAALAASPRVRAIGIQGFVSLAQKMVG